MIKELSAGVIITDGLTILGCRPFGKQNLKHCYDLPKGHVEEGEDFKAAAIRETEEETGYIIHNPEALIDLGRFPYIPTKDLYLYLYAVDSLPDTRSLKCTTYWDTAGGFQVPEVAGYKLIPIEELDWFFKSLSPVVEQALNKFETL